MASVIEGVLEFKDTMLWNLAELVVLVFPMIGLIPKESVCSNPFRLVTLLMNA
jgi:hypothetical protein